MTFRVNLGILRVSILKEFDEMFKKTLSVAPKRISYFSSHTGQCISRIKPSSPSAYTAMLPLNVWIGYSHPQPNLQSYAPISGCADRLARKAATVSLLALPVN